MDRPPSPSRWPPCRSQYRAHFHRRLAIPFAPFVFAALGRSARPAALARGALLGRPRLHRARLRSTTRCSASVSSSARRGACPPRSRCGSRTLVFGLAVDPAAAQRPARHGVTIATPPGFVAVNDGDGRWLADATIADDAAPRPPARRGRRARCARAGRGRSGSRAHGARVDRRRATGAARRAPRRRARAAARRCALRRPIDRSREIAVTAALRSAGAPVPRPAFGGAFRSRGAWRARRVERRRRDLARSARRATPRPGCAPAHRSRRSRARSRAPARPCAASTTPAARIPICT